jgi:DNA mismatch endonuclease, patch repair protein
MSALRSWRLGERQIGEKSDRTSASTVRANVRPSRARWAEPKRMDRVSKTTRSKIMAAVHTRDTGAEKAVRSIVHRLGFRYSLKRDDLPGRPDLVMVSRRKVIFVHGCFWHGHSCRWGRLPKSRLDYWKPKIAVNKARDRRQANSLRKAGWSVMIVWQCQLKKKDALEARIEGFVNG